MAYTPTNWQPGDVITKAKMDKIENQLAENTAEIEAARGKGSASGSLGARIDDMIILSDTQPTSSDNEIWIKSSSSGGVEVPTYEEFEELRDSVAVEYTSTTYAIGDYTYHEGTLYRCTTAITAPEPWTSGHWSEVKVGTELSNTNSAVATINNNLSSVGENKFVRYDAAQTLTDAQKATARENIGATDDADVEELKSAIKQLLIAHTDTITFDQGGLSAASASGFSSTTRIRSHSVLPTNILGFTTPSGKIAWVYAFDENNTYIGRYIGNNTFSKSTATGVSAQDLTDALFSELGGLSSYTYKLVILNADNSDIVPSDASALQYYYAADSTLSISGKPADALATHNAINDVDLVVGGAKTQVTEIVNPNMSRTQFVKACDAQWTNYSNLCLCNNKSFWSLNGTTTFEEAYLRLNANFRDDTYIPGMTVQTICDRINKAFATPIHRFEDARLNLTVPCDFSVKFTDRSGEPSLIVSSDGGELWCYGYGYRFKTNDGVNWTRESIVKDTQNSIGHNGMSVIDDTIYLITRDYQNNNDLLMYTSPLSDGLNFTYQGIVLDKGHDFGDGLSITNWGNSCMCKINGTYYLYIEGKDAQNRNFWDTYLVTCSDPLEPQQGGTIGDWQNSSVAPIISGSVLHPASSSAVSVGNPDFAKGPDNRPIRDANGKWFLYVHSTAFSYSYIHRLSSYDLVHWAHDGQIYDNRNVPTAGENQSSNADQAIIEFKGRTYFFYTTDINTTLNPHLAYMIDDRPIRDIIAMRP